jgi:hypothetical protein
MVSSITAGKHILAQSDSKLRIVNCVQRSGSEWVGDASIGGGSVHDINPYPTSARNNLKS